VLFYWYEEKEVILFPLFSFLFLERLSYKLENLLSYMEKISAGSYDLNVFLHGGYESEVISVIYGPSGAGKTNLCLLVAVSQAKKGNNVLFIDTEGGFSVERIQQLAGGDASALLPHIFVLQPTSFGEQQQAFQQLGRYLKQGVSVVIVDGMTILYRLESAGLPEEQLRKANRQLASHMRQLAEIARKRHIPVIVTNQVYRWEDTTKMVGGDVLQYWSKCHLELIRENGTRRILLRKHRSLPEKELVFDIVELGIKKKGLF
jgi:DNA repair protein RadB